MPHASEYALYLLKLTGEVLLENGDHFSVAAADIIAEEIVSVVKDPAVRLAIVIGGGNILRGEELEKKGFDRRIADQMGMLATVQNALFLEQTLKQKGVEARSMTAIEVKQAAEPYILKRALRHLDKGRVIVLAGGVGRTGVSTDFAAAQSAWELGAAAILKGTKVEGIYDKDPKKHTDAKFIPEISYDDVIIQRLKVMDDAAFSYARDKFMKPTHVFNIFQKGNLSRVIHGEKIGSVIHCFFTPYPAAT